MRILRVEKVITKREFKKIEKETEVRVVGFSKLEKFKEEKHRNYTGMVYPNGKMYLVRRDMGGVTKKYADIGGDEYIAIKGSIWPLLLLLLLLLLALFMYKPKGEIIITEEGIEIDLDKQPMVDDEPGIAFPGFNVEYILTGKTDEDKVLNLINPKNNTVYFKYEIYLGEEVIYQTDWIPPNRMVQANLWDILPAGTHSIEARVTTKDCVTKEVCTSSVMPTKVTIKNK